MNLQEKFTSRAGFILGQQQNKKWTANNATSKNRVTCTASGQK